MRTARLEVADVFREYGAEFLARHGQSLSPPERRALRDITRCRTAALGGHKLVYSCGHEEISYNSCRNRHCPKCQASARAEWLEREAGYLLDVKYFHVVFTLPAELGPLAQSNPRQIYDALFRVAAETLLTIARDPKHLGAEIGFLMVLHTWGQNLHLHPHVHCVVPGGGLSADGTQWIPCREHFFLPVRVLSRLFRGKFLAQLEHLYATGKLSFPGALAPLGKPSAYKAFLDSLREREWVVYSKPPFGGPRQVLKYLARYTHRVAISNQRLLSLEDGKVAFRWKDYAQGGKQRVMRLEATEFLRRFLLHVLPPGFVRIRHYGFLSNRSREEKLGLLRTLLSAQGEPRTTVAPEPLQDTQDPETSLPELCPRCRVGRLILREEIPPTDAYQRQPHFHDTS